MKRILIISFSDLGRDPRVARQIRFLQGRYSLTALGLADPGVPGVEFIPARITGRSLRRRLENALRLKAGRFEAHYWDAEKRRLAGLLATSRFDLILANEIEALPLALRAAAGAKVLIDAHEFSPSEFDDSFRWRFFYQRYREWLCRRYLRQADAMTTVSGGIAERYADRFGVSPLVIDNAPFFADLNPSPVSDGAVRMVHHGAAIASRRLERMVRALDLLDDRFRLDLMLVPGTPGCLERLQRLAVGRPRLRLVPPQPLARIVPALNAYDVGLYILPPSNFNNAQALPNKLFEFIQARIAAAIGPSPEMARIVRGCGCGVVADDFSPAAMARALSGLDAGLIRRLKAGAHAAAGELCAEKNRDVLLGLVARLLGE